MLAQNSELTRSESEQGLFSESCHLPTSCAENTAQQTCSVISVPPVSNKATLSHLTKPVTFTRPFIPNIVVHQNSPGVFHRSFYSG